MRCRIPLACPEFHSGAELDSRGSGELLESRGQYKRKVGKEGVGGSTDEPDSSPHSPSGTIHLAQTCFVPAKYPSSKVHLCSSPSSSLFF